MAGKKTPNRSPKRNSTSAPKKGAARAGKKASKRVQIKQVPGKISITYDDPRHVLPHLLGLASDFAGKHFDTVEYTSADDDVLGTEAAREIVSGCANSDCWDCTIGDLKLNSTLFQGCVYDGVTTKGYVIERKDIPATQDTQLYTVVMAIQGAKRK
jgi:hypothetical protein